MMRMRNAPIALAVLALSGLLSSCFHAETVDENPESSEKGRDAYIPTDLPVPDFGAESTLREKSGVLAPVSTPIYESPAELFAPEGIWNIKRVLIDKGYLRIPAEQSLDPITETALIEFQEDSGLVPTGFPDTKTLEALGLHPSRVYRRYLQEGSPE